MVSDSWLWRISREIEANQKRNLNPDRRRIFRGWDYKKLLNIHATFEAQKDRNNETVLSSGYLGDAGPLYHYNFDKWR